MAKPNSRATYITYCKRALGHPVIEINVDDDQVDDRVDEALQFYQEYHQDAVEKVFLTHKVTGSSLTLSAAVASNFTVGETITGSISGATAVIKTATASTITYAGLGNSNSPFVAETITGGTSAATATVSTIAKGNIETGTIVINDLITSVVRVMPIKDSEDGGVDMFDIKYQMHLNDVFSLGFMGSLAEYNMTMDWLAMLDLLIGNQNKHVDFNRHRNTLRIDMDWSEEVAIDSYIIIECYRIIDPATYTDVYNDYFLKKYGTALIKQQWGANLIKFEGMVMPGGVTFNGRQIYDDALQDIEKLTEEARLNWELPVDFMTG